MTIYVDKAYDEKPNFDFNPASQRSPETTFVLVIRDGDSITVEGRLTVVPTKFTATLKNGTKFTFISGREAQIESTVHPTTEPSTSTKIPEESVLKMTQGRTGNCSDNFKWYSGIHVAHTSSPCIIEPILSSIV